MGTKNTEEYSLQELKSKLEDDGEIDLSMSELTTIPIKNLSVIPKCTFLDLSLNKLTVLPESFSRSLRQLVKLDLSKNNLTHLPRDIYLLQRLQHLDLYKNKLQILPLEFGQLTSLRWLDLKDNMFSGELQKAVGDCLDDRECKKCAKDVVAFMKAAQAEKDRQTSIRRQREIENAERRKKLEEQKEREEKEKKKKEKKKLKEQKQKEWKAKHPTEAKARVVEEVEKPREEKNKTPDKEKGWCGYISMAFGVALVAMAVGAYVYCQENQRDQTCMTTTQNIKQVQTSASEATSNAVTTITSYITEAQTSLSPYFYQAGQMLKNAANWVIALPYNFPQAIDTASTYCRIAWDFVFPYFDQGVNLLIYGLSQIYALLVTGWTMLWPSIEPTWLVLAPYYNTAAQKITDYFRFVVYSF